jgi:ComF family protein
MKPEITTFCEKCAKTYISGKKAIITSVKINDKIIDIFAIDEFERIKEIVHDLKYNGVSRYACDLLKLGMTPFYEALQDADFVTCVPLHPLRFVRRGYNQSEILAKTAAKELDIEYKNTMLRTRYNFSQTKKNAEQRKKAAVGLFVMRKNCEIADKTVIIIDDVYTTGATIAECVRILYEAKVKKTIVLCLAKA